MYSIKVLQSPTFYISAYLEARREEYYERLLAVSRDGDWTGWCVFFLTALTEQARENYEKARAILDLYGTEKERIIALTRSQYAIRALDFMFNRPIFTSTAFTKGAEIPKPTAARILNLLRKDGVLIDLRPAVGRSTATLAFSVLLNIAEGRTLF